MISRRRVREFNKILTCLLCKGYLIEATTINTCMHSFCRSCIIKHIKLFETCPTCDTEIRLGNLRPDYRLQSIVYKIIPGLYAKERQKITNDGYEHHRIILNGSTSASSTSGTALVNKLYDISNEDETLAKQYFYDPEEPISLSLEYHMESIFGSNNVSSISNNIPQVRYLQAPAAFKVLHMKKFLSSKYDLSNLKKPMCIDIIYEGDIMSDEFTLMDIAYTYKWEREAPLKLFYRIYKSKKHNNTNNEINLIKKALINQPFVRLNKEEFYDIMEPKVRKMSSIIDDKNHSSNHYDVHHSNGKRKTSSEQQPANIQRQQSDAPRHDLKIIIAKKPSSKNSKIFDVSSSGSGVKVKLNKPNSGDGGSYVSKVLSENCERLRGSVDNFTSSDFASTSEMKTTLSKKTGTVSHHDLKFENKSGSSSRHNSSHNNNNNSDSHDSYEFTVNEEEREREQKQKRENTKHTNSSSSSSPSASSSSSSSSAAVVSTVEKFKVKSSLSSSKLNIPKLKIELPSLKTNISIPKTPNESYAISKSPFSNNAKCEPHVKKVRFDMSGTTVSSSSHKERCYDFDDEMESLQQYDQKKYAERIGLRPVERKVESIILHRKRKKSKHSKESEHSSKKQKLHVSSSLDDESLKLKLKIMGGKKKLNHNNNNNNVEDEAYEKTCNFKTTDHHSKRQEKHKEAVAVEPLENHKYSVTEQKISQKNSDADQPLVFIPKLVLQKTSLCGGSKKRDETLASASSSSPSSSKVQRRSSILGDQPKEKSQQSSLPVQSSSSLPNSDADKSKDTIKLKIKPLDKLAEKSSNGASKNANGDQPSSKLMKPPTAKMGSPSSDIHAQITSTLASSPIRPNSIPASLKLSPITATAASPTISVKSDLQLQNQKRSLSLGAEKSPHCYINPYAKTNTEMFTRDPPLVSIPPLIPTSTTIRSFYSSNSNSNNSTSNNSFEQIARVAPVTISKVPNINVKDPIKLFPNACPSVEILKIPQAAPSQQQQPSVKNVKLNRQMPPTIPLEKIKQSAQQQQQQLLQGISPKLMQSHQNLMKVSNYQQASKNLNLPHLAADVAYSSNSISDACHSPLRTDISLERYTYELSKDISKLDQSLSLEKNFEHWGKMKLQEFSKIGDLKSFATSPTAKSLLNLQNMNLSVRNIPNPSALMMFRNNQSNHSNSSSIQKTQAASPTVSSPTSSMCRETVSSSTSEQCSDIEEIISKSTIAKGLEKPFADFNAFAFLQKSFANSSVTFSPSTTTATTAANHSAKINEKKSIEKLTEYLRQTATAAKSKQEMKLDDDNNNNNNNSSSNSVSKSDKNFNLIDGRQKTSALDVICIDS